MLNPLLVVCVCCVFVSRLERRRKEGRKRWKEEKREKETDSQRVTTREMGDFFPLQKQRSRERRENENVKKRKERNEVRPP